MAMLIETTCHRIGSIGESSPSCLDGPTFLGSEARAEWLKSDAPRAESGGGVLRGGTASHIPTSQRSGEAPATKMFSYILEAPHGLSRNWQGAKFVGSMD